MRTDFKSIPTMDYGRCILHLPYSYFLTLLLVIPGSMISKVSAACISEVRVTLNGNGEASLTSNMFVTKNPGDYTLQVQNSPLTNKTMVDCSFRGESVSVVLTNSLTGITCWSTLYIDDKSDYTVSTTDTLINCLLNMDSIDIVELIEIDDNCFEIDDFDITYNDVLDSVLTGSIDTFKSFTRIWGLKDPDGNKRTVTSKIFSKRFNFNDISVPATDTVYCPESALDLNITGVPSYFDMDLNDYCGVMQATTLLDSVNQGCDANVKYRRLWIITDWDRDTMVIDTQTIFRIDTITKSFLVPTLSYSDIADSCMFSFVVPEPNISGLGCSSVPMEYINAFVNGVSVAVGDSIILDYGDFILGYSGRDDCFNPIDLTVDSLSFSGMGLPILSCTNIKTLAISLTDSVLQRSIRADALYSADNITGCIDANIKGRRVDGGCSSDNMFADLVHFCIDDTMTTVSVEIVAVDSLGNMSEDICVIDVIVDYKIEPVPPVTAVPENILANVPRASCYQLVYQDSLTEAFLDESVYDVNNTAVLSDYNYERVAYYLELEHPTLGSRWIWVSMRDFTDGNMLEAGFPIDFFHDTLVNDMDILSNDPNIITGDGWNTGNVEIWNTSYGAIANGPAIGGDGGVFDFDDSFNSTGLPGYGSFQVHNYGTGQTLFAINDFRSSTFDIGIGNSSTAEPDWTFASNGNQYTVKDFYVLLGEDCEAVIEPDCVTSIDIYISPIDSLATILPLSLFGSRGNASYSSITGSGSSVSSTGSGFVFGAPFISFDSLGNITGDLSFDCDGIGNYELDLTMSDVDNSNAFNCSIDLWVLDTASICTGSGSTMGSIYAWGSHSLEGAQINIIEESAIATTMTSSFDGTFEAHMSGGDILLQVEYGDNWYDHVTSNDLFYLEQLVTGFMDGTAMERLAADIDGNGKINGLDFILLKRLLLGEEPDIIYTDDSWLFYDAGLECKELWNCQNDFIEFNESDDIEIIGLKKGDIDADVTSSMESRNIKKLNFSLIPQSSEFNNMAELVISTEQIRDVSSFQLELEIPNAINVKIVNDQLIYRYADDKLRIIYLERDGNELRDIHIGLTFDQSYSEQSDMIRASSNFENQSFSNVGKSMITLINKGISENDPIENIDFSIYPNPSASDARIRVLTDNITDEVMQLTIFDELGIMISNKIYPSTALDNTIGLPDYLDKGVYSIVMKQGNNIATKKYIKM